MGWFDNDIDAESVIEAGYSEELAGYLEGKSMDRVVNVVDFNRAAGQDLNYELLQFLTNPEMQDEFDMGYESASRISDIQRSIRNEALESDQAVNGLDFGGAERDYSFGDADGVPNEMPKSKEELEQAKPEADDRTVVEQWYNRSSDAIMKMDI